MKKIVLLFILLSTVSFSQVTCTATANGDWTTAGIWSCGHVPTCGDLAYIPAGITVSVLSQIDLSSCNSAATCSVSCTGSCATTGVDLYVATGGKLYFKNGNKLKLPCCSFIVVGVNGTIQPGSGGGISNYIEICTDKVWTADSGNVVTSNCFPKPCNPLPVEFIAFTGDLEQKIVNLYWKTATETINNYYNVEKSSDGINFETIGVVKTKAPDGNSLSPLEYDFIDKDLKHPIYYYRLKQVDLNGKYVHTRSISVKIYAAEFSIFPNPNNGTFSIDVPSVNLHEELSVKIYNALGQIVHESVESVKNHNITGSRVDVTPSQLLPKGIYFSTISFKGETHQLKLVVQ
jgi:Secretion system C-terminal sorting domain